MHDDRSIRLVCRGGSFDHPDEVLAAFAERQAGVVARTQLLDAGLGVGAVDGRCATKHLQPVRLGRRPLAGVYAVGRAELDRRGRQWAAQLASGDRSVLAAHTAADVEDLLASERLHVIVPPDVVRRPSGVLVRRRALEEVDVVADEDGARRTAWPRTSLDVAAMGTAKELRVLLDRTVTLRVFDAGEVEDVLLRYPGTHGAPALRAALAEMTDDGDRAQRGLEDDLIDLVLAAVALGLLPRPLVNAPVLPPYVGDLVWPAEKLIVEADGRRWHAGPFAERADHERQARLEAAGWRVLRVRWADVHRHPERTIARIVAALA